MTYTFLVLAALVAYAIATDVSKEALAPENMHPFFLPKAMFDAHYARLNKADTQVSHLTNRARNYANIDCDQRHSQRCQARYADNLHATPNIFRDPEEFIRTLTRYYNNSVENGLIPLCAYRAEYFTCLNELYEPCTDFWQIIRQLGSDNFRDAFFLAYLYKSVAFDCLGGNIQLTANYQCQLDTMKNADHQAAEQNCFNAYMDANKNDQENVCSHAQTLMNCSASLYLNNTCPSTELAWWRCEHTRVGFQMDGFCPDLDCNVVLNQPAALATDDVVQTANGGSFGSPGLNEYGLSPEWERRMIGGGAFVSDARLHLYQKLSRYHMKNMALGN